MSAPLEGLRVLEFGSRLGVGACARALADLGASVLVVEPRAPRRDRKWVDRALATAGRRSVLFDPARADDVDALVRLARRCDAVLLSSDVDAPVPGLEAALGALPIVCDLTAFGHSGPLAGRAAEEAEIQALTGLMHTTGFAQAPPAAIGVPVCEFSAGLYAAAAVVLAWRELLRAGVRQSADIALFDTAFNALTTFLPAHFAGGTPSRLGNGHAMAVPWNAYRGADGWVLICSANDPQWRKFARAVDPPLADDARYATLKQRLAARAEVDALVEGWTRRHAVADIVARLNDCGIACGAIVTVADLPREPNLALRGSVVEVRDPAGGARLRTPGALAHFDDAAPAPPVLPMPDDARAAAQGWGERAYPARAAAAAAPLAGLRVVEIGQFTTAPLAARHLASFGADVVKVEPEDGESARAWAPHRGGTSLFFVMTNGSKRAVGIDMATSAGAAAFEALVVGADVLVENMKPGALARLGFGAERLRALNPRLIYCAISGFGARSVYAGRPAFDTVVQAMSGLMDASSVEGVPMKAGISAADIGGGQVGLLAIVAALVRRDRDGAGAVIDIAMQDVGAWLTQSLWNAPPPAPAVPPAAVADVAAACAHPQTLARELVVRRRDAAGIEWELLGSPLRLSATPPVIGAPLGPPAAELPDWLDARRLPV